MPSFIWIPIAILLVIFVIIIHIWTHYENKKWKEKVESIKTELDLVEGCTYDITQNNGRTTKNLMFVKVYSGNRSPNGYINLLFTKISNYRNATIKKQVIIKYESVWKVFKHDETTNIDKEMD